MTTITSQRPAPVTRGSGSYDHLPFTGGRKLSQATNRELIDFLKSKNPPGLNVNAGHLELMEFYASELGKIQQAASNAATKTWLGD
jgi:hypothetical protein